MKLQERSDDTPESCKLVRKKEYPADKRKVQEKLPPTQAERAENTIKENEQTEEVQFSQPTVFPL